MQAIESEAFSNKEKINMHLDYVKYKELQYHLD